MSRLFLYISMVGALFVAQPAFAEGDLPQLNISTYPSQIFWLLVSFLSLYIVISRLAIPRISGILQNRMRKIDADLSAARKYRREIETNIAEMDTTLEQGRLEAQEFLRSKHHSLIEKMGKQQASAVKEIVTSINEGERNILDAKLDALAEIDAMAGELVEKCVVLAGGKKPTKTVLKSALKAE